MSSSVLMPISERMYKSRLHTWGLDKKKKEHEMLDLVRQGLSHGGADKDKVFVVRGKEVTLADALHYFNRKGIKDPASLLESNGDLRMQREDSSPEDFDVQTPLSSRGDILDVANPLSDSDYDMPQSPDMTLVSLNPERIEYLKSADLASERLHRLVQDLRFGRLEPLPPFRNISVEAHISNDRPSDPDSGRYFDAIYAQAQIHYRELFQKRNVKLNSDESTWSVTSDSPSDHFYYLMYHGYSYLWNDQKRAAFDNFHKAFDMIEHLLLEGHSGFLIYIFDLIIRHDGTGYEEPLLLMLHQLTQLSEVVFKNKTNPIYLISSWLLNAPPDVSKSWIALSTMRKLLDFFQDSIGYFHGETVTLLQTFATGLLNKKLYREAAVRFQQLVDALSLTRSRNCYEVAYAYRSTSEAYFYLGDYRSALSALNMALEHSRGIPWPEEREIHVRCLRALAEISNAVNRRDEAMASIGYVVEICAAVFGPEHAFTNRARMHQKSLRKGESLRDGALPPMVYRLGRGGNAALHVWTTRSSPTRLQT